MFWVSFLLITILISNPILAQDYTKLFRAELPEKIYEDKSYLPTINDNIKFLISIHPKTLFYYFDHLNKFLGENILKPDSNGSKELNNAREYFLSERSDWAENQILIIDRQINHTLRRNASEADFEDFVLSSNNKKTDLPPMNKNLSEYYMYKYFLLNDTLNFDDKINYAELNSAIVENKLKNIKNMLTSLNSKNKDDVDAVISEIKGNWYLQKDYSDLFKQAEISITPASVLMDYYSDKFYEDSGIIVSGEYNLTNDKVTIFDATLVYEDYVLPTFINPMHYEYDIKIVNSIIFSGGIGYKFKLKDEVGFLSNIKAVLFYNFLDSEIDFPDKNTDFYRFTYNVISGSSREDYIYHISDINNFRNEFFSLRVKAPVFYLTKRFYAEIGIGVDYQMCSFDIQIDRRAERITNGVPELLNQEQKGEYKYDWSQIYFSPSLFINYEVMNNLTVNLAFIETSGYRRAILGVEARF